MPGNAQDVGRVCRAGGGSEVSILTVQTVANCSNCFTMGLKQFSEPAARRPNRATQNSTVTPRNL